MKKIGLLVLICLLLFCILVGCSGNKESEEDENLTVAVAIPPLKTFVEKVAGKDVSIVTVIPPGNSPANYQPSPKEMVAISNAKVYFTFNMPTEQANILHKLPELNSKAALVDLQERVFTVYPSRQITAHYHEDEHEEEHEGEEESVHIDPHVWLSPKRAIVIVEGIRDTLVKLDSKNEKLYKENSAAYIKELKKLDKEIISEFKDKKSKTFIIFHPTYGYFADDYGLKMVPIEVDGKEATAKGLEDVINTAKKDNVKAVFYQAEFDNSQAKIIANELGGETIRVAPLSTNYIESLKETVTKMKNVME